MSTAMAVLLVSVLFNSLGNVLIKVSMNYAGPLDLAQPFRTLATIFFNPVVLAGIGCYVIALAGSSYTFSRLNLSIAYPIMSGLSFMMVLVISTLLLQEKIQPFQVAGCLVIMLGVWMIASTLSSTSAPELAQTAGVVREGQ